MIPLPVGKLMFSIVTSVKFCDMAAVSVKCEWHPLKIGHIVATTLNHLPFPVFNIRLSWETYPGDHFPTDSSVWSGSSCYVTSYV